jgi:hypothetical protein
MRKNACFGLLAVSSTLAALIASAGADVIAPCSLPNGAASSLVSEAPAALLRALKARIGEVVPPAADFDSTDVVVTGRSRRLIFIWNVGRRWVVATEHGGIVYNNPIFAYDLSRDSRSAVLVQERSALPKTVCSTASSLLGSAPR